MRQMMTPEQFQQNIDTPGQCQLGTSCDKQNGKCEKCSAMVTVLTDVLKMFNNTEVSSEGKHKIYG